MVMQKALLQPLEPYPGRTKHWRCKCLKCGRETTTSFASVRTNGGGCKPCGISQAKSKRATNEADAIEVMIGAGAKPLEPYQNNKAKWKCQCLKCGKEIFPTFGNVKNNKTNPCGYCSGKKVDPNDAVALMRSKNLEPLEPFPGSNKKWKCRHLDCGEVVATAYGWILAGQGGCQKCGYKQAGLKGRIDESEAVAEIISKKLTPLEPYKGAGKPWKCRCEVCGHISSPTLGSIKSGSGCGICAGKIVVPEVAREIMLKAGLEPLVPYPGSATNWKCRCMTCGENVYPNYSDIKQGDGGCKYCARHFVKPEDAVALMLASDLEPLEAYKNSGHKWRCKCLKCNREVFPTYNTVQQRGGGCKYCAKRFVDAEEAVLLMFDQQLEPLVPYPGGNKKWKCRCLKCTREVSPTYSAVKSGQQGCAYCARKKVDPEEAFEFMQSRGLTPLEPYSRSDGKWKCRCIKCLKIVTPSYSSVRSGQSGCVYCSKKKVDPDDAIALFLENNLKPLVPFKTTDTKWKSECMKCKNIVFPTHHMVSQRSGGCKYCSSLGMDFTKPAYIYLITHEEFGAHKIGISGEYASENRILDHAKQGWKLYKKRTFESADQTYNIEQEVLRWLREDLGLPPFLSLENMPQRGWTETVDADAVDLPTIWAKVEELSRRA
jgi:recombinational DNA repair protein (RecF pathway)